MNHDLLSPPQPDAPVTYYDQPMLKRPHWGWNVVTYLFLGGVMGGSSILAAIAQPQQTPSQKYLRRNANRTALVLAAACPIVLISHLGRPERFLNMLRIVKLKSPMSLGVWGLLAFSGIATVSVVRDLAEDGIVPKWMRVLAPPGSAMLQALLGAFIAGYTGVLISATAIPLWAKGKRHIPAASVCSGLSGACALQSLLLLPGDNHVALEKLERLELAVSAAELLVLFDFEHHAGEYGRPMFTGKHGAALRTGTMLLGLGVPLAINAVRVVARPRGTFGKLLTALSSVLTLGGGYILRNTFIESGKTSADDPHVAFRQPE